MPPPSASKALDWAILRLGEDHNWWVAEISDPVRWDVDGLSVLDPRQVAHLIEVGTQLRDYGFDMDLINHAFFTFRIEKEMTGGRIQIRRTKESIIETEEPLFALPDVLDEDKGPYADLLDYLTRARVKLLNESIKFDQPLTVDEVEETIRESQNNALMEGRAVHFFDEINDILEFVPDGFELEVDEEETTRVKGEENLGDLSDFEIEEDEKIDEDDTMKWDEDEDKDKDALPKDGEEEEDEEEEDEEGEDEDEKPRGKTAGKAAPAKGAVKPEPKAPAKPAPKPASKAPAKPAAKPEPKAPAKPAPKPAAKAPAKPAPKKR